MQRLKPPNFPTFTHDRSGASFGRSLNNLKVEQGQSMIRPVFGIGISSCCARNLHVTRIQRYFGQITQEKVIFSSLKGSNYNGHDSFDSRVHTEDAGNNFFHECARRFHCVQTPEVLQNKEADEHSFRGIQKALEISNRKLGEGLVCRYALNNIAVKNCRYQKLFSLAPRPDPR